MSLQLPTTAGLPLFGPQEPSPQPTGPDWKLTERQVYRHLHNHQGRDRAVKCDALAESLGMESRQLQSVIHDLIHVHGIAVGSAMQEPFGYFLARTEAELETVVKMFDDRARSIRETGDTLRTKGREEMERRGRTAA